MKPTLKRILQWLTALLITLGVLAGPYTSEALAKTCCITNGGIIFRPPHVDTTPGR